MTRRPAIPLRLYVATFVLSPVLFLFGVLAWLSMREMRQLAEALIDREMQTSAELVAREIDRSASNAILLSDVMSHDESHLHPGDDPTTWVRTMQGLIRTTWPVSSVAVWDAKAGSVIWLERIGMRWEFGVWNATDPTLREYAVSEDGQIGTEPIKAYPFQPRGRPWVEAALGEELAAFGEPYFWLDALRENGQPLEEQVSVPYSRRLLDDDGSLRGVVAIDIAVGRIRETLRGVRLMQQGVLTIVDSEGFLVTSNDASVNDSAGRRDRLLESHSPVTREAARVLLGGRERSEWPVSVSRGFQFQGVRYWARLESIEASVAPTAAKLRWRLLAVVPRPVYFETDETLMQRILLISMAGGILALGLSLIFANRLASVVGRIETFTRQISQGRFDARIDTRGPAEFQVIADSLNRMAGQLSMLVSLRAERDAAEQSLRSRNAFFAGVSHELRTPLNAIVGYAEMLQEGARRDGRSDDVEDLNRLLLATRELLKHVNELLELARVDAAALPIEPGPVRLAEVIATSLDLTRPLVELIGNRIEVGEIEPTLTVFADAGRLTQVLVNLISNAGKFTRNGLVSIRVDSKGDEVAIRVCDTGPGIEPELLPHLFEPFRQGDAGLRSNRPGSGLGLSLCKRLTELMGGRISVISRPGSGTEFAVHLKRSGDSRQKSAC